MRQKLIDDYYKNVKPTNKKKITIFLPMDNKKSNDPNRKRNFCRLRKNLSIPNSVRTLRLFCHNPLLDQRGWNNWAAPGARSCADMERTHTYTKHMREWTKAQKYEGKKKQNERKKNWNKTKEMYILQSKVENSGNPITIAMRSAHTATYNGGDKHYIR